MIAFYILKTYRPDAEIIGITTVSGNTYIDNVVKNVRNLCYLIFIYQGRHFD